MKNLFKCRKRKKSKKEIIPKEKEVKFIKIKNIYKKFLKYLKNHKEKINSIKKFFLIIFGYGLVINYSLHFIFGTKFNLFSLFAFGIAYYFISDEFVEWFRRLIVKR